VGEPKYDDRYRGDGHGSLCDRLFLVQHGRGMQTTSAAFPASYRLTSRILLSTTETVTALLGKVNDSRQVEHKTQPAGILTAAYRFYLCLLPGMSAFSRPS
jgi:hypothetical protein